MVETQHRDRRAAHPVGRSWFEVDGSSVLTEGFMDWVSGIGGETLRWIENGVWRERRFALYLYTATELGRLLKQAGFTDVEMFGGLDGRALTPDSRLVAIAR